MDQNLHALLGVVFSAEVAGRLDGVRQGLPRQGPEKLAELSRNFRSLIDQRELTLREWSEISDLEFDDEDALYAYLRAAYDYLFEGAETPPPPPWY